LAAKFNLGRDVFQNLFHKKLVLIFLALAFVGGASVLRADEILLREGKTLHGKITHEDANEVMIRTAPTMYLRIERSKISKITRSPQTGPTNTVRTVTVTPAAVNKSTAAVSKSTTPVNPPTVKPAVAAVAPEAPKPIPAKAGVTFAETINKQSVAVPNITAWSPKLSKPALELSWLGASEKDASNFKWKSLVLTSTITLMTPTSPSLTPADQAVVDKQNQGRVDIYHSIIESLSQALMSLRSESEAKLKETSQILVDSSLARAEIRQRGYSRHLVEEKRSINKK
jgi:hypothetical protein